MPINIVGINVRNKNGGVYMNMYIHISNARDSLGFYKLISTFTDQ
jgi:hypothetical protein